MSAEPKQQVSEQENDYRPYYDLPPGPKRDLQRSVELRQYAPNNELFIHSTVHPEVILAYNQLPDHLKQIGLTIPKAISMKLLGDHILKPFEIEVNTGRPEVMYTVYPQDKQWYDRICGEVADVNNLKAVDLYTKNGERLDNFSIGDILAKKQGVVEVRRSNKKPFDSSIPVPEPQFFTHLAEKEEEEAAGDKNDFSYRAKVYSENLAHTIAEKIASRLSEHKNDSRALNEEMHKLTKFNNTLPLVSSALLSKEGSVRSLEDSGIVFPGNFANELAYRTAESVGAFYKPGGIKNLSPKHVQGKIGGLLLNCDIKNSFINAHTNMLAWMATRGLYSYKEDALYDSSSSDAGANDAYISASESSEDDDARAPYRRRQRIKRLKRRRRGEVLGYSGLLTGGYHSGSDSDSDQEGPANSHKITYKTYAKLAVKHHKTLFGVKKRTVNLKAGKKVTIHKKVHHRHHSSSDSSSSDEPRQYIDSYRRIHKRDSSSEEQSTSSSDGEVRPDLPWAKHLSNIRKVGGTRIYVIVPSNLLHKGISYEKYKGMDLKKAMKEHTIQVPVGEKLNTGEIYKSMCGSAEYMCGTDEDGSTTLNGHKVTECSASEYLPGAFDLHVDMPDGVNFTCN